MKGIRNERVAGGGEEEEEEGGWKITLLIGCFKGDILQGGQVSISSLMENGLLLMR